MSIVRQTIAKLLVQKSIQGSTVRSKMNGFIKIEEPGTDTAPVIPISNNVAIRQAANLLESGQVIALPTDTVYGLACSANNPAAIQQLYAIKGRHGQKPVAICVADFDDLRYWGQADHLSDKLLQQLLPGAVTIVVRKSSHLDNPFLNPGVEKIGIRIPDFKFIRDVSRAFRYPIALTSANKSACQSTLNVHEFQCLWSSLGAVFDGGQLGLSEEQRAASTVIDLSEAESYRLIRAGVAAEHTKRVVEKFNFFANH
ncbi:threonylcarbamoyl-AMP synthase [Anopheles bellator]|uniref:threonylcarbamoyl-AMP synthase n=1 Tax=Anopheles bellator TaxID=139047 RepID=UPI00264A47D7|nr:threonylcarbamoyl-AMP synthase [Anopheles bellator]